MASSAFPYKQDVPPPGGFPELSFRRQLPKWGPSPRKALLGVVVFTVAATYYKAKGASYTWWFHQQEERQMMRDLTPYLAAEETRRTMRNQRRQQFFLADKVQWKFGNKSFPFSYLNRKDPQPTPTSSASL
ncbi:NADH dehydrogenase 1 alpha subcomplex subunit 13 ndufa13/GRIM19 [Balamuthia mandrillaris]